MYVVLAKEKPDIRSITRLKLGVGQAYDRPAD
jgi:hypothetical protein